MIEVLWGDTENGMRGMRGMQGMRIPFSVYWKFCSIDLLLFSIYFLSRSRIICCKRLLYSLSRLLFVSRSLSLELLIKSKLSSFNHWLVIMDGQEQINVNNEVNKTILK